MPWSKSDVTMAHRTHNICWGPSPHRALTAPQPSTLILLMLFFLRASQVWDPPLRKFLNDSLACINKGCNCVWIFNRTLIAYRLESQNHFIVPGHQIDAHCSALNGRAVCCNGHNPVSDLKCISELSCCCFCVHSQLDHIFWDFDLTNQQHIHIYVVIFRISLVVSKCLKQLSFSPPLEL